MSDLLKELESLASELKGEGCWGAASTVLKAVEELQRLLEIAELAFVYVEDSYQPTAKYDFERFMNLRSAVLNYKRRAQQEQSDVFD